MRKLNEKAENLIDLYFPVLDHGFISLKDYCGSDSSIVRAARTSYQHGTTTKSTDRGLIRYLLRHNHSTPFEFVNFTFHCQMPIMVARQWIRHRIGGFNEMSGRYSIMSLMFYTPDRENIKQQSTRNNQGRDFILDENIVNKFLDKINISRDLVKDIYEGSLLDDISRELARLDLPLSTYTNWYWTVNLSSLMNFMKLRCHEHAQWEIIQYGNVIAGIVKEICPLAFEAWLDYSFMAEKFSYQEMQLLRHIIDDAAYCGDCLGLEECMPSDKQGDKFGLSKRELDEFTARFISPKRRPDFSLDISKAKTAEFFEEESRKYVVGLR